MPVTAVRLLALLLLLAFPVPARGSVIYDAYAGFYPANFFYLDAGGLDPGTVDSFDFSYGGALCPAAGSPNYLCARIRATTGINSGRLFLGTGVRMKRTNAQFTQEHGVYAGARIDIYNVGGYASGPAPGAYFVFGLHGTLTSSVTTAAVTVNSYAVATLYAGSGGGVQCFGPMGCPPFSQQKIKVTNWNPADGFSLVLRSDVKMLNPDAVTGWDGEGVADFYDTFELLAVQLLDANDQPIPDVTLTFTDKNGQTIVIPDTPPGPTATVTPTPTNTPTITPTPAERTVISYFLPKSLKLKLAGAGKDTLTATGSFDDGNLPADFTQPVRIDIGGFSRTVTMAAKDPNTFAFKDATFSLAVKGHLKGSSRGSFKLKVSRATLAGLIDPVGTVELHFHASGLPDALGVVTLTDGAFVLGKLRGDLVAPAFFPFKASVVANDVKPDMLSFGGGFGDAGPTPTVLGDVHIALGDTFDQTIAGSAFTRKGKIFSHTEKGAGTLLSVSLDFGHGIMKVKSKGIEVGTFSSVTADFVVDLGGSDPPVRTTVRLGSVGANRVY